MYLIVTDPFDGMLPLDVKWTPDGVGGYASSGGMIVFTIADAKVFESREAAEAEAFMLAVEIPPLVGHLHVVPESEARIEHQKRMEDFIERLNKDDKPRGTGCFGLAS